MKKLYLSILTALFIVGARAEKPDNVPPLSIWFDTPNNLDGRAIWQRADGKVKTRTKLGKQVHCLWEMVVLEPTLWVLLLPNVLH